MIGMAVFSIFAGILCASATAVVRTHNLVHIPVVLSAFFTELQL